MSKATIPKAEEAFMRDLYSKANVILEYGSGASTHKAASLPEKYVMSVESDLAWARNLRSELSQQNHASQIVVYHVDIGPTGPWGRALDEGGWRRYHHYPSAIWDEKFFRHPNVILIDGRFRTACLVNTIMRVTCLVTVLFDDYVHRLKYRLVERKISPREIVGRMARFEINPSQFRPEHFSFVISQFFEVTLHGKGAAAYES